MKHLSASVLSIVAVSLISLVLVAAQPDADPPKTGLFANLRKGQEIGLKDVGTSFEVTILADQPGPLGFTILEVGHDFLVLRDISGIQEVRIPLYAIKAITTISMPKQE
jgi:hypothetical protein